MSTRGLFYHTMESLVVTCSVPLGKFLNIAFDKTVFDPRYHLQKEAAIRSADFIRQHGTEAVVYPASYKPAQLWRLAVDSAKLTGLFLECGVYRGASINFFAKRRPTQQFHGFDSFGGLPESWAGSFYAKGAFEVDKLPKVRENVTLHRGFFEETLPVFAANNSDKAIAFLNIDSDLYSSAQTIFKYLGPLLTTGSIIVFDEYLNMPMWEEHEHKAFTEFVETTGVKYHFIAFQGTRAVVIID